MKDPLMKILRREVDEYQECGMRFVIDFMCCGYRGDLFFGEGSTDCRRRISCECQPWLCGLNKDRWLDINPICLASKCKFTFG